MIGELAEFREDSNRFSMPNQQLTSPGYSGLNNRKNARLASAKRRRTGGPQA